MFGRYRWLLIFFAALVTAGGGLFLGKMKEKDYVGQMYARKDFTLLDDKGELFQLSKFPSDKLLLLIFTPDSIPPAWVKPFREFSRKLGELKSLDVESMMITRTNREIARNFKEASAFPSPMLVDTSGTVGRLVGIWPGPGAAGYWGYALVDNRLQVYWAATSAQPMKYGALLAELKKLSTSISKPTSSESP
jgi:peroxiredoxin